jgi:guanylate kinase
MLVLSSPSGAGKTTLARLLLDSDPNVAMSVSATTRPKRPGEVDGRDYVFISEKKFQRMVEAGEFLEHATVFGHRYGTPREPVLEALTAGRDVLFDIDWQGTQQLRQQVREDVVTIFVLPPSRAELERRLHTRAQDSAEVVAKRMAKANDEISHWAEYDYVIVNEDVARAQAQVATILLAERLKRARQPGIPAFIETLTRGK